MGFEVSPVPDKRQFPYISVNFLPYVTWRTIALSCPEMAQRIGDLTRGLLLYPFLYLAQHLIFREGSGIQY